VYLPGHGNDFAIEPTTPLVIVSAPGTPFIPQLPAVPPLRTFDTSLDTPA
jgi:hypothetical protein